MRNSLLLSALYSLLTLAVQGQIPDSSPIADTAGLRIMICRLSSARMEGREAGTRGAARAAGYIAGLMKKAGLEPFPESHSIRGQDQERMGSWFQSFKLIRCPLPAKDSISLPDSSDIYGPVYEDGDYYLAGDTLIDVTRVKTDTITAMNVAGILKGTDTSRCIIIGAHYDHLGVHQGMVFPGADDNASGVAGIIALARYWSGINGQPPCNLIFAAWSAEEKGELGSKYFVNRFNLSPGRILCYFNLDMVSGSAPEDSSRRQLSIGTMASGERLRQMASEINRRRGSLFDLDLWDVTGHSGSDYKYFSLAGIQVMTFFSGFTSYYHTPDDTIRRSDVMKMTKILDLINQCIIGVLSTSGGAIRP
jgi:hypothetical protein